MKAVLVKNALCVWPDPKLPFVVETDASNYQLGGVIKQNGEPVAFYSHKLNSAQKNYTTTEKDCLSRRHSFIA